MGATRPSGGRSAAGEGGDRRRRRLGGVRPGAGRLADQLGQGGTAAVRRAGSTAKDAPTSRPPGPAAFGNLVVNWSFEQDLSGWEVLGAADAAQEPQGRTSGSCASVRARGPEPGRAGLALPQVGPSAKRAGAMWPRPGCARPPPASR